MMNTEQRTEPSNRPLALFRGVYESLHDDLSKDTDEFTFSDFEAWTGCELTREYRPRVRAASEVSAGRPHACDDRAASLETTYYILADMVRQLGQKIRDELDIKAWPREYGPARRARWAQAAIERASDEYRLRNFSSAVVALDIAMELAPHEALTQLMTLRGALPIHWIYLGFIGDTGAVPRQVVPMSRLDSRDIDCRKAFVLSRIDGSLTVDEFVDAVGLPRFEALHYLCMMVLKGIIHLS